MRAILYRLLILYLSLMAYGHCYFYLLFIALDVYLYFIYYLLFFDYLIRKWCI